MDGKQLKLVIIDTDYDYLKTLEEDIIRRFSSAVSIQVITDPGYAEAFFSGKQKIDLLLVDEESYGDYLQQHDIKRMFLMAREIRVNKKYPDNVSVLMKYMPKEEILSKMDEALSLTGSGAEGKNTSADSKTRIVAVYSPIGGCGKSLACAAIADKLKKLDQKVLLVSCDGMQSLAAYYPETPVASPELAEKLKDPDESTYWTILQNVGQDRVSYVLPFEKSLSSLGITPKEMHVLVNTVAEKGDFDVIVLDVGTVLNREMAEQLSTIDTLVLITETNEIAGRKMKKLLKEPELLPRCSCLLIANEYRSDGTRINRDTVFGAVAPYQTWLEALDDPVFYRIALKIIE